MSPLLIPFGLGVGILYLLTSKSSSGSTIAKTDDGKHATGVLFNLSDDFEIVSPSKGETKIVSGADYLLSVRKKGPRAAGAPAADALLIAKAEDPMPGAPPKDSKTRLFVTELVQAFTKDGNIALPSDGYGGYAIEVMPSDVLMVPNTDTVDFISVFTAPDGKKLQFIDKKSEAAGKLVEVSARYVFPSGPEGEKPATETISSSASAYSLRGVLDGKGDKSVFDRANELVGDGPANFALMRIDDVARIRKGDLPKEIELLVVVNASPEDRYLYTVGAPWLAVMPV